MNEITKYLSEREEEFEKLDLFEWSTINKDILMEFHSQTIKGLISKIIEENEKRKKTEHFAIHTKDYIPTSTTGIEEYKNVGFNLAIEDINNSLKQLL